MTCNILVLFTNDSEKLAKELVSHFDNVSINAISIDSLANSPNFRLGAKAKINIIFFSPQLLKFLEIRPLDAFHICSQLDTNSVMAVFCCGLTERNVLCYHMAPLKSFNSWCKFEISDQRSGSGNKGHVVFPPELLSRIYNVIAEGDQDAIEVIVVPQSLNRTRNVVYLIFTGPIQKPEDMKICLNDPNEIDISLELVNPYVMRFSIPEFLFQYSHNVKIIVQAKDCVIANPIVHLSQDSSSEFPTNRERNVSIVQPRLTTKDELLLDEQLKFLTSFSSECQDTLINTAKSFPKKRRVKPYFKKSKSTEDQDLYNLCKRYGLEQLSFLISNEVSFTNDTETQNGEDEADKDNDRREDVSAGNECKLPDMDSSNRLDSYLNEETDLFRLRSTRRSLSLPSTLIPSVDRDGYDHYMDMTGVERRDLKPHERLLRTFRSPFERRNTQRHSNSFQKEMFDSFASGHYVSLMLSSSHSKDIRSLLKKDLSRSQQELLDIMQDFKDGECTISSVEKEFQLWQERHCTAAATRTEQYGRGQREKKHKTSVFVLPWKSNGQRKTKKKESKKTETEPSQECTTPRKISNPRSSSASSKASDASKIYSRYEGNSNELITEDAVTPTTGWISSYSPLSRPVCPLNPEKYPPPLPTRPPPSPVIKPPMRPMPLPRRQVPSVPANTANENKNSNESGGDETTSQNISDLCHKYGLQEIGNCNDSKMSEEVVITKERSCTPEDSEPRKRNSTLKNISRETPLCLFLRANKEETHEGEFRRSTSLPSDLQKFEEVSLNLIDKSSGEISYIEKESKPFNFEDTKESIKSNVYMTLLELHKGSLTNECPQTPKMNLSESQEELLELIYAFKRGEKTMSQVQQQFGEWHCRNIGVRATNTKDVRKQPSFRTGIRNLIKGKPRKKSYTDKNLDNDVIVARNKNSVTCYCNQKRLSNISNTSNLSMNSEYNDVFRTNKDSGREAEASGSSTSSVRSMRPRRPIMPPRHASLGRTDSAKELRNSPEKDYQPSTPDAAAKMKPVPPPKPKMLSRSNAIGKQENQSTPNSADPDSENTDTTSRSISPDYIVPDVHIPKLRKKSPIAKLATQLASKVRISLNSKDLGHSERGQTSTASVLELRPPQRLELLPPQTLESLMVANLLAPENESRFYIRRPSSYPSMRVSDESSQHLYMELLRCATNNSFPRRSPEPDGASTEKKTHEKSMQ